MTSLLTEKENFKCFRCENDSTIFQMNITLGKEFYFKNCCEDEMITSMSDEMVLINPFSLQRNVQRVLHDQDNKIKV